MQQTLCAILATFLMFQVGYAEDTLRLGMSAAFTGPSAALGNEMRRGAVVYFNHYNREWRDGGLPLELLTEDDAYEPYRTIYNVRQFTEQDKVFALFGFVGTPTSQVAVPIATRRKIPFFAPFTGAGFLREPVNRYVLNVRASYKDEAQRIVGHIVDKLHLESVGLFIQDDAFGSAGRSGVEAALKQRGLPDPIVGKYQRNTMDIENALVQLKAASPAAVVMVCTYAPCAEFIKKARASGFSPRFFVMSFVGTRAFIEALGEDGHDVMVSQVMPSPTHSKLPIVEEYRKAMAAAGESQLDYGSLEGYVAAKVFSHISHHAAKPVTAESFIDAAEHMRNFDIGGISLSFGPDDHQGMDGVYLTEIRNGAAVPLDEKMD